MPIKKATMKHDYEMKQTDANNFSNIFDGINISKAPDNSTITINITGDMKLEIPTLSSVDPAFYTNNSGLINDIISKVASNIKTNDYKLSGLLIKEEDTRDFITSFKRISVEIGANNPNTDTDTYKLINESNLTFNTYKDHINVTANTTNFRDTFITYFQNKQPEFLKIFDLLKYSSMNVSTYKTYEFNIYAKTRFEFDTKTFEKLIKIN